MTQKPPEIELSQLKTALLFLAFHWETKAQEETRRIYNLSPEDKVAVVNRYGSFTQASTALRLLIQKIEALAEDAPGDLAAKVALQASSEAGDIWE